ncbi:hypothetical protein BD410DRAFT_404523 [Rickenella mellea]|uniref:Uncharacterized protein n=1 Tax=Rickenella mellea TaxID=50990 RepID=A0A4Y7PX84_9AGAM|nr:hypothetical protein BD410DRAFT_404523 [Rickenella mellea]
MTSKTTTICSKWYLWIGASRPRSLECSVNDITIRCRAIQSYYFTCWVSVQVRILDIPECLLVCNECNFSGVTIYGIPSQNRTGISEPARTDGTKFGMNNFFGGFFSSLIMNSSTPLGRNIVQISSWVSTSQLRVRPSMSFLHRDLGISLLISCAGAPESVIRHIKRV